MRVYRINYDFERYYSFSIANAELGRKMPDFSPRFKAKARKNTWVSPVAQFFKSVNYKGKDVSLPDITTCYAGNLVLNGKAYDALHERLSPLGEFLGVTYEEENYYMFNNLTVIDDSTIDERKSEIFTRDEVYIGGEPLVFNENCILPWVFKTRFDRLVLSYCGDAFYEEVTKLGLTGLIFNKVM